MKPQISKSCRNLKTGSEIFFQNLVSTTLVHEDQKILKRFNKRKQKLFANKKALIKNNSLSFSNINNSFSKRYFYFYFKRRLC